MYAKCILLLSLCLAIATTMTAKVRNGYAPELVSARECLQELSRRLIEHPDMHESERRRINAAIRRHTETVAHYHLTNALLKQMQQIAPAMYGEIDQLKDKRGRETDIYVRFVPESSTPVTLSGASFFQVSKLDEDASQSRFGELTVAIDVWICDTALHLLAHEFGHTQYIVPNLASYRTFYRNTYINSNLHSHMGHSPADASGKMAYAFGQQFLRDRRNFKVESGPIVHVYTIFKNVRKDVRELVESKFDDALASATSFE